MAPFFRRSAARSSPQASRGKDRFLDLNEKIGGYDQDFNYVPNRVVGDRGAIHRAYESGLQQVAAQV